VKSIPLTRGLVAVIDEADYERISAHKWYTLTSGPRFYAITEIGGAQVLMHRFVLDYSGPLDIDHIDGDELNNRRANLRVVTRAQNLWNQGPRKGKRFKGVQRVASGRYMARMMVNGERLYFGTHATEEEAARVYDDAARKYHGEFARLNFPEAA
jgi:hypothetical protein